MKVISTILFTLVMIIIWTSLDVRLHSQKIDNSSLDFPFEIEKTIIKLPLSRFEGRTYYVYLEEIYFSRKNLQKLFAELSKDRRNLVTATVFSDRKALAQEIKGDETTMLDYPNTAEGIKAKEEFYRRFYSPNFGVLWCDYSNSITSEFFDYTPKAELAPVIRVILRDDRQLIPNNGFLMEAVNDGYFDAVKQYLTKSKNVNFQDEEGRTLLMRALSLQHFDIAKLLIQSGATISIPRDLDGLSALHFAAIGGDYDSVKLLIDNKAEVKAVDKKGKTALMYAANRCNAGAVKLLISSGIDVNTQAIDGTTALTHSCDNEDVLAELSAYGANPNAIAKDGTTPMFFAIENLQMNKLKVFLPKGALVNIKAKDGRTPMSIAESLPDSPEKAKIVEFLRKYEKR
jgi:ankyrin repeat protein